MIQKSKVVCYNENMNKIEKLNAILQSYEFSNFLSKQFGNKFRLCLNKNNVEEIRTFVSNFINAYLILDVNEKDFSSVCDDFKSLVESKLKNLALQSKVDIYKYLNDKFNKNSFFLHGTSFSVDRQFDFVRLNEYLTVVNDIYESYGIYKCFESKIKEKDDFWLTNAVRSAVFYAYQSPEFLARFASRSDYYKQDPYIYDRQAYYRKDYRACKKNCLIEMKSFGFSNEDKHKVLKYFKYIWDIVISSLETPKLVLVENLPQVLYKHEFTKHQLENMSYFDIYNSFFLKQNFSVERKDVIFNGLTINLPKIEHILKKEHPVSNKKYVFYNKRKFYPDFYCVGNLFPKTVYFLSEQKTEIPNSKIIDLSNVDEKTKIELVMNYTTNSKKAKNIMKDWEKEFTIEKLKDVYKSRLKNLVKKFDLCHKDTERAKIILKICKEDGLRYLALVHFNCYFKNVNQAFMYTYTKLLGSEFYDVFLKSEKINKEDLEHLLKIYQVLLNKPRKIIESNYLTNKIKGIQTKLF